jgi:hypothetical protein
VLVDLFRTAPVIHQNLGLANRGAVPLPHFADQKIFGSMPSGGIEKIFGLLKPQAPEQKAPEAILSEVNKTAGNILKVVTKNYRAK